MLVAAHCLLLKTINKIIPFSDFEFASLKIINRRKVSQRLLFVLVDEPNQLSVNAPAVCNDLVFQKLNERVPDFHHFCNILLHFKLNIVRLDIFDLLSSD